MAEFDGDGLGGVFLSVLKLHVVLLDQTVHLLQQLSGEVCDHTVAVRQSVTKKPDMLARPVTIQANGSLTEEPPYRLLAEWAANVQRRDQTANSILVQKPCVHLLTVTGPEGQHPVLGG